VNGFVQSAIGPVPRVNTKLSRRDTFGTIGARTGFFRNNYLITPGLYAIGNPTADSPVIATANYKLTFDTVREALTTLDIWILVVDTRGINVWCAAGKGTFSADEIIYQAKRCRLSERVNHRTLILPQLAAAGVAALKLKEGCGFRGKFGPVRITDLPQFLADDMQADEQMRSVTFSLRERTVLIPVEVCLIYKPLLITLLCVGLLSGICPDIFSLNTAISRSFQFFTATLLAIAAGAIMTPLCLPLIPGRQFWFKGILAAVPAAIACILLYRDVTSTFSVIALCSWIFASSSYMAMNFTGSTPFTSLSGVELEMRRGIPLQLVATFMALCLWLAGPFFS
jgi:hypothetical protein